MNDPKKVVNTLFSAEYKIFGGAPTEAQDKSTFGSYPGLIFF